MATRKAITLVSGLFQEVNTPTDKLDFAGNTTADLSENTNLYFTNTRARSAVSVTDAGGLGSLAYNSSTGVITYTGPSNSDIRGLLSIASGSGLTYNSSTGEFGTSAIPNSQLANDDVTIGSTAVALGATASTIAGLTSLASGTLIAGTEDAANAIEIGSGNITFEGSTADANETILTAADATGGDKTLTLPNETGTILTSASGLNASNINSGTINTARLPTTITHAGQVILQATGAGNDVKLDAADAIVLEAGEEEDGAILFRGNSGADSYRFSKSGQTAIEGFLSFESLSTDRVFTFPDSAGTLALLTSLSIASGSGLTYNSSTGEFSTNAIPNSKLANSSVTVGSTAIALGNSSTTLAGLSSVTSTAVVTNDSGFRIRNNSDNTKIGAFSSASITGGQTRTLTFPDADGTIATQSYVNSQITAEDLDITTDDGNSIAIDLDSETLTLAGGTGIASTSTGNTATFAIDSTVATKTGSATLTNKTIALGSNTVSGTLAQFNTAVSDATLVSTTGSETLTNKTIALGSNTVSGALANGITATTQSASDNSTKVATTAYVDNAVSPEFADNVFRVKDNSDASKKLAFECSGISGSTTRTMTVPDTDGTISTESFATAIAVALG